MLAPLQHTQFKRRIRSASITVPPPVQGLVSMNDPRAMNMTTARILTNIVPRRSYMESRRGCAEVADIQGPKLIDTMMSYQAGAATTLIAAANNRLYDCPTSPPSDGNVPIPTVLRGSLSNTRFQHILMADGSDTMRLVMVNGEDGLFVYEHVGGVVEIEPDPVVPGLLDVTNFKGRLWFTEDQTTTVWYGDPLSNQPATLTPFQIGPILRHGGTCLAIDSVSLDGGDGPDDFLVIVTTEGEVVVFSGIDPATDFNLVGVFKVPKPVSVRCLAKLGEDLIYYSASGPESVSKLYKGLGKVDFSANPIQDKFEERYQINPNAHGWEILNYDAQSWVICNVPLLYPNSFNQFVLNLSTNAWFMIDGWEAVSFCEHDGALYYGDKRGQVFIADFGYDDNGSAIPIDYMMSWNEFGTPNVKKFNLCKMTIRSQTKPSPSIDMMVDYVENEPTSVTDFPLDAIESPWDISPWNTSPWSSAPLFSRSTFGLKDHGYVGALRYRENLKNSYRRIYGYQVLFEPGDIL